MRDFNHTVGILVQAYLNDTLKHQNCHACAIGNIVAGNMGIELCEMENYFGHNVLGWKGHPWMAASIENSGWVNVFATMRISKSSEPTQTINPGNYKDRSKEQIDSTGYTWEELAKIEFAFESSNAGETDDEWMFNGLMAVVDVLAEIHGINLTEKESAKALFVKA